MMIFRDNPHKTKVIFMRAFVGALFTRNTNKTNNKQHVNRGYDSESGTTSLENPPLRRVFAFGVLGDFWSS